MYKKKPPAPVPAITKPYLVPPFGRFRGGSEDTGDTGITDTSALLAK